MTKDVVVCGGLFVLRYSNYRLRPLTNEERYEGYMRGDFRAKSALTFDKVEIVRL